MQLANDERKTMQVNEKLNVIDMGNILRLLDN